MSLRRALCFPLAAFLLAGLTGCADVADRFEGLRAGAEDATDSARFCLSLARAAAALDTGSPDTAADAVEELLVHAPDRVRDDARTVVDGVRRAEERGEDVWEDEEIRAAVARLRDDTRELCDPR